MRLARRLSLNTFQFSGMSPTPRSQASDNPSPVKRERLKDWPFPFPSLRGEGAGVRGMASPGWWGAYLELFALHDLEVVRRFVVFVQRAHQDVEARRNAVGGHRSHRQTHVAGRLRVLPHRGVYVAVDHFLCRVGRVAPADHWNRPRFDADLSEHAL